MDRHIFGVRNNVEILDLAQTKTMLSSALSFLQGVAEQGKTILIVGTHPAARKIVEEAGEETHMPKVTRRWIGGTLTNFSVISKRIETMERLEREETSGEFAKYTKKERLRLREELERLQMKFNGIRLLKGMPAIVIAASAVEDENAIREAHLMHIPVIAVCDTNANPHLIDYPIPANDDALPAVRYVIGRMKEAILEGKKQQKKDE